MTPALFVEFRLETIRQARPGENGLDKCESDQARAKQDDTGHGHSKETFGSEFIAHGTPPIAGPARMERPSPCTVKEFSSVRPFSTRVDVFLQHPFKRSDERLLVAESVA
jgi:hypothetical protein